MRQNPGRSSPGLPVTDFPPITNPDPTAHWVVGAGALDSTLLCRVGHTTVHERSRRSPNRFTWFSPRLFCVAHRFAWFSPRMLTLCQRVVHSTVIHTFTPVTPGTSPLVGRSSTCHSPLVGLGSLSSVMTLRVTCANAWFTPRLLCTPGIVAPTRFIIGLGLRRGQRSSSTAAHTVTRCMAMVRSIGSLSKILPHNGGSLELPS